MINTLNELSDYLSKLRKDTLSNKSDIKNSIMSRNFDCTDHLSNKCFARAQLFNYVDNSNAADRVKKYDNEYFLCDNGDSDENSNCIEKVSLRNQFFIDRFGKGDKNAEVVRWEKSIANDVEILLFVLGVRTPSNKGGHAFPKKNVKISSKRNLSYMAGKAYYINNLFINSEKIVNITLYRFVTSPLLYEYISMLLADEKIQITAEMNYHLKDLLSLSNEITDIIPDLTFKFRIITQHNIYSYSNYDNKVIFRLPDFIIYDNSKMYKYSVYTPAPNTAKDLYKILSRNMQLGMYKPQRDLKGFIFNELVSNCNINKELLLDSVKTDNNTKEDNRQSLIYIASSMQSCIKLNPAVNMQNTTTYVRRYLYSIFELGFIVKINTIDTSSFIKPPTLNKTSDNICHIFIEDGFILLSPLNKIELQAGNSIDKIEKEEIHEWKIPNTLIKLFEFILFKQDSNLKGDIIICADGSDKHIYYKNKISPYIELSPSTLQFSMMCSKLSVIKNVINCEHLYETANKVSILLWGDDS